jgi:hypothetical protein
VVAGWCELSCDGWSRMTCEDWAIFNCCQPNCTWVDAINENFLSDFDAIGSWSYSGGVLTCNGSGSLTSKDIAPSLNHSAYAALLAGFTIPDGVIIKLYPSWPNGDSVYWTTASGVTTTSVLGSTGLPMDTAQGPSSFLPGFGGLEAVNIDGCSGGMLYSVPPGYLCELVDMQTLGSSAVVRCPVRTNAKIRLEVSDSFGPVSFTGFGGGQEFGTGGACFSKTTTIQPCLNTTATVEVSGFPFVIYHPSTLPYNLFVINGTYTLAAHGCRTTIYWVEEYYVLTKTGARTIVQPTDEAIPPGYVKADYFALFVDSKFDMNACQTTVTVSIYFGGVMWSAATVTNDLLRCVDMAGSHATGTMTISLSGVSPFDATMTVDSVT